MLLPGRGTVITGLKEQSRFLNPNHAVTLPECGLYRAFRRRRRKPQGHRGGIRRSPRRAAERGLGLGSGEGEDAARRTPRGLSELAAMDIPLKGERRRDRDPGCSRRTRPRLVVEFFTESPFGPTLKSVVTARNIKQRLYVQTIDRHDLVFAIGPAGTGKTYLAVAMAAAALLEKKVKRIVLARPAVEAGERLGFLPGDMVEKINPYLRPLYDALYDILGYERTAKLLERGIIEVAPIAFMRGRTLNDAFIILDEAQNTTSEQMKMFLTRIGFGSKAVVTGDITQMDLPQGKTSGLREAQQLLSASRGSVSCSSTSATSSAIPSSSRSSRPTTRSTASVRPAIARTSSGR